VGPVDIMVSCSSGRGGRSRRHKVTIDTDWTADTGHDLELERIAAAFGSGLSCVPLVDRVLPAVRQFWLAQQRMIPLGIVPDHDGFWHIKEPPPDCACAGRSGNWTGPEGAAEHARTLRHCAASWQAAPSSTARLVEKIEIAAGTQFVRRRRSWPRSPAVPHFTDFSWLWDVGLSPETVNELHHQLGLTEPMAAVGYLHIASAEIDLTWLRTHAAAGPERVRWVASTFCERDRTHPTDRLAWLEAGAHPRSVAVLLNGTYSVADLRELAERTGRSASAAAATLADWIPTGCRPDVDRLVRLWTLAPTAAQVPPVAAIDRAVAALGVLAGDLERTDIALMVAATGSVPAAIASIQRGIGWDQL
jgi:hypothetical protein